ncbi:hypothetical protein GH714_029230 [Hevea brasiliensis]|uniref:Uncharacterized protein n=1 Tax=Hevea brasiliensis TaxID=3981 RepID=A0A6A6LFY0_HEVBR|nr:hypothetical protein GH714_029230 [Hevea brasiliensis]
MAAENFVQPAIPRFDGHYDHWSMLMENFLRSKEYWTVVESGLADPAADVVLSDAQKAEHEALKLKDLKAKNYLFQAIDRYGHYQSECRTNLNRDGGRQSNFAEKEEDSEITLLMAYQALNQTEEDTKQNIWYLDTAASNHMSGNKSVFSFLDESYQDSVKFGNNSRVSIMGKGQVTIQTTRNVTHKISDVFYVPDLKTNLLSVGQLQEKGDVVFEKNFWSWDEIVTSVKIPTNFDGENEEEVPTAVSGNSQNDVDDVPNSNLAPIMEAETETPTNSRAQRIRKRPAWMSDYECGDGGKMLFVCLYVDDLIYTGNDGVMFENFKRSMMLEFDMSDLGRLHYFLGIEVVQSADGIFISQKKYVQEILDRFQMSNCNSVTTPSDVGLKLTKDQDNKKIDSTLFKQIVGSLMYLTATRPDIMHAVSVISRYMENP